MSNIFEGTGVKRYALRYRESYNSPWQYPTDLEYDTLTEATTALKGMEAPGRYEIVEKRVSLRYVPGRVQESPILRNLLDEVGFGPYILQRGNDYTGWENCYDRSFATLEEAQMATSSTYRVASASIDLCYDPVEVSG